MRQLIWKDFVIQKRTFYIYAVIGLVFFFYFDALDVKNLFAVFMPTLMIIYSFANRSMAEDEKYHSIRMLASLPIPRAKIVKAKYISLALATVITALVFLIIGSLFGAYSLRDTEARASNLWGIASFLFVCTFLLSVFMPLVYRIGVVRAQTINRFFFFGLFALGTAAGAISEMIADRINLDENPPAWLQWVDRIGPWFTELNPYVGSVCLLALSGLLYVVSLRISILLFEKREEL